jgi:hypothetical protein
MIAEVEDYRAAANFDRVLRVLRCAMRSAIVTQTVGEFEVCLKLEVADDQEIDFTELRKQLVTAFSGTTAKRSEVWERTDAFYTQLCRMYNDNKVSVTVTDSDGCGYTVCYYNHMPTQLIKI